MCISSYWKCDGQSDCPDHSDERNCDKTERTHSACPAGEFICNGTGENRLPKLSLGKLHPSPSPSRGLCLPNVWKCDGRPDCDDGSDESPDTCHPKCGKEMFTCGDKTCIPIRWVCDKHKDCPGGADEGTRCLSFMRGKCI
jgi:hypothetical protein